MSAPPPSTRVDAGRLWAGGLATAAVAALTAVAGIVIARGVLHVPVLAPRGDGIWGDASTAAYALWAGAGALVATALLQVLAMTTPRYGRFFGWLMALSTAIATAVPLGLATGTASRLATCVLNLVLGIAITTTLSAVGRSAIRRRY
ncbi:DUF6069 family protein [Amycolatopsis magusensis]|uniref:DUF6069 family protein n=1 Tax=Amycolatopsis magusensis TaxID=882444 RepID=UPI0024A7FA3B|nr:DUF6069 family protein [Amycolatopsis magusensis]MDI5978154.1 DUF6069 family protein [Amycolatopsis magusensis]